MGRIVFDLLAELGNVDVHRTGVHGIGVFVAPNLAQEFGTRNGMIAVVPQVFKNFDFLTGKGEFFRATNTGVFAEVHAQATGNKLTFVLHGLTAATEHGVNTSEQHGNRERLRNVVVGTELKTVDDIVIRILCRQDNDGEGTVLLTDLVANGEAIHAREHQVQQDQVVLTREGFGKARLAVGTVLDHVAVHIAEVDEAFGNGDFIFDNKDFGAACIFSH